MSRINSGYAHVDAFTVYCRLLISSRINCASLVSRGEKQLRGRLIDRVAPLANLNSRSPTYRVRRAKRATEGEEVSRIDTVILFMRLSRMPAGTKARGRF